MSSLQAAERTLLIASFAAGLAFCLVLNGALPLLASPTLGQAVWTTGFSQSFLNESLFNLYARNIGAPEPAAIAFGLAGAWVTAVFMKLGLAPADAYSAMTAFWLTTAFVSAFSLGRYLAVPAALAIVAAVGWVSMPMIWAHAGYSMVAMGIALLPLYFLLALRLLLPASPAASPRDAATVVRAVLPHTAVCVVAVFMDGYSFMMFAVGAGILGVALAALEPNRRRWIAIVGLPGHVASIAIAYLLYTLYLGKTQFEPSHIDFFRGWGVDLTFLLIPSQGVLWLPDALGWARPRSTAVFFGDSSVWRTTYSLPLIVGGMWALVTATAERRLVLGLALVGAFAFYMALGPSLKINSTKPEGQPEGPLMDAAYALAPTGSALLSSHLPGFNNMRASYRWQALGALSAWALLLIAMSRPHRRHRATAAVVLGLVTVLNLPDMPRKLQADINFRERFFQLEVELVAGLADHVRHRERVAFLPWSNDFLATFVAARLDVVAFNIGGDKNLAEARLHWPETLSTFPKAAIDGQFGSRVLLLLAREEADVAVLPYMDLLSGAHEWPPRLTQKALLDPVLDELRASGYLDVTTTDLYAVVRLLPEHIESAKHGDLAERIASGLCLPPDCLSRTQLASIDHSRVGRLEAGTLLTTGEAGFVHFGPYVPMRPGRYELVILGTVGHSADAWADVVSAKGSVRHAWYPLESETRGEGVLVRSRLVLAAPVEDLEIRLYVGPEDELALHGYELRPLGAHRTDTRANRRAPFNLGSR
jgi:hypothetical protein